MIKIDLAYFSPHKTSQMAARCLGENIGEISDVYDLIKKPLTETTVIPSDHLLIVSAPVFSGRLPAVASGLISKIKGDNTPCIVLAVYGNRAYGDALLELYDIMNANGFCVIGAGAIVAEHSLFPTTATGRPDDKDKEKIKDFAISCKEKLKSEVVFDGKLNIPGNNPYKPLKGAPGPFAPVGDDKCINCKTCVKVCSANAIDATNTTQTDNTKCISCVACITACPAKSRHFSGEAYLTAQNNFTLSYSARIEPEFFI